jgi:hypothetical protein
VKLFRRPDAPPASVLSDLPDDERVVSWADTADGSVVLATPSGLWWPAESGPRLIGWQLVDKAVWHEDVLTVVEADVVDDVLLVDRAPMSTVLSVPRDLPPTVRKRVERTIVRSDMVAVPGGAARFVARRVPGRNGVIWWARLEPGTPDTAPARAAVRERVDLLRRRAEEEQRAQ